MAPIKHLTRIQAAALGFNGIEPSKGSDAWRDYRMSDSFWANFVGNTWDKGPVLIRSPFKVPLISEKEFFEVICRASDDYRSKKRGSVTVWISNRRQDCDVNDYLPNFGDGSLERYKERVVRMFGECSNTSYYTGCQMYSFDLWTRVRRFLRPLYDRVGLPASIADIDIFFGRYERTPSGIHRDGAANFSYVVSGTKRMLFWSSEALRALAYPKGMILGTDRYESFAETATVVEGKSGDLIFWPPSYWHMATSDNGWSTTVNIALFLRRDFLNTFRELLNTPEFSMWLNNRHTIPATVPDNGSVIGCNPVAPIELTEEIVAFRELANHPSLVETVEDLWFRKVSASGFEKVPGPVEICEVSYSDIVMADPQFPILARRRNNGKTRIFANGQALEVPGDESIFGMIAMLNSGREQTVDELIRGALGESSFDTGNCAARRLKHVLELLLSYRSIVRNGGT